VAEDEVVVEVVAVDEVDVALAMTVIVKESPTNTTLTTSGRSLHQSRSRKSVSLEKIVTKQRSVAKIQSDRDKWQQTDQSNCNAENTNASNNNACSLGAIMTQHQNGNGEGGN